MSRKVIFWKTHTFGLKTKTQHHGRRTLITIQWPNVQWCEVYIG